MISSIAALLVLGFVFFAAVPAIEQLTKRDFQVFKRLFGYEQDEFLGFGMQGVSLMLAGLCLALASILVNLF